MDKPQVYVNVSGGIAEATVTRGDVEVIECDWDNFRDMPEDFEREDLLNKREQLQRVADPQYRERLLVDMDELIARWDESVEEERLAAEEYRQREIAHAKAVLAKAGQL